MSQFKQMEETQFDELSKDFRQTVCGQCGGKIVKIRRILDGGQIGSWGTNCSNEECSMHIKVGEVSNWKNE